MSNLQKRIFTSSILSAVLLICIFLNKYSFLILLIIASTICFFEFNNLAKKIWKKKEPSIYSANVISFFYLIFFTYSTYEIYKSGLSKIIFILLVCIFTDIGGYVVGKSIRGKKLTKISPNKTISGTIGSFIFSLIPIIFFFGFHNFFSFETSFMMVNIFLCLSCSLMCQMGDLFISYFKRKAKVKNTGTILPGHGGILDRVDGIIFALPVYSFFVMNWSSRISNFFN